ncbi:hypothetical protein KHS38_02080 [Mucilaginibacter sp. Bleaf8]|uniref:hypothetical protein n=1 Tax=Mucilaginibacter sp. Bleaf8 TaxID=2834430 RepID=UPI001BCCAD94|nr:hypothetical protein [Mucilaginibacter sp. Bleaf8]MBS7563182.1 hypothetical protein [Mucilaginibacter sp. Bleaf8]
MNAYQQKWIDLLSSAQIKNWNISAIGEDILIELSDDTRVTSVLENLPEVIAAMSLDITVPKERLKFVLQNGHEHNEYILNPTDADLNTARND